MPRYYVTIGIRKDLVDSIKAVISTPGFGYRSITEFVNDAVRRRLEELNMLSNRSYPLAVARGRGDEVGIRADSGDEPVSFVEKNGER